MISGRDQFSASWRGAARAAAVLFAGLTWLAFAPKAEALTITSVSGSVMYIDIEMQAANSLLGAYEGYRITTGAAESYSDLWVTTSGFSGAIGRAPNEDGIRHLGPIAANSSLYVYFYLAASAEQTTPLNHTISVFNGGTTGAAIQTLVVPMTSSERGSTNNNKITVVTHTPSGPGIGGTLVMTIQGNTGTMTNENPNVFLTPASKTDWPADVFELESMTSTFSYGAMQGGPQTRANELTFATNQTVAVDYTVVYTFRIVNLKLTPTTVQPVNYLSSGGQMKHTSIDSNDYTDAIMLAGTIPQPQMQLQLTRTPISPAEAKVPGLGGTYTHRLRVSNAFTQDAIIDSFSDVFASPPGTPSYVASSAVLTTVNMSGTTIGTRAGPTPVIATAGANTTWKFTDYYTIPAGGYIELAYGVSYPAGSGRYQQRAIATVGTTQIDTTKPATLTTPADDAPAIVFTAVGDADLDGVYDIADVDADNDGISDLVESGLAADPDLDGDNDGVQNYRDSSFVTCTDAVAPIGTCDTLPAAVDFDGDGIANHLDLDSDGDGLTDAYEAEAGDANGDGKPDGCTSVNGGGQCASGLIASPRNTDGADGRDFLDSDSDGDGVSDFNESRDTNGDGVADVAVTAADNDTDGIKDTFDPSCTMAVPCAGIVGSPILAVLTAAQDQNGDGAPDWLQTCGDAYTTTGEACDDGNLTSTDACNNMCLLGIGQVCTAGAQCGSTRCDGGLGTCQTCTNSVASGTDSGCTGAAPTCTTTTGTNSCVFCDDSGSGTDDGCTAGSPLCNESANGGLGACVQCLTAANCDDGNSCTTNTCSAGTCSFPPVSAGNACTGGVCNGSSACVTCIDNAAAGATDSGCGGGAPACDPSANGGLGACVQCAGVADCGDGNSCTTDACASGSCTHDPEPAGTSCSGGVCDGTAGAACVACVNDGNCSGGNVCVAQACVACENNQAGLATDRGCSVGAPLCDTSGTPHCVACIADADCGDSNECTTDSCSAGVCSHTSRSEGAACTGGVCDGAAASPACVSCVDDAAAGATDSGCGGATPACNESANGGAGACVACSGAADCGDGNACTQDMCTSGSCSNPAESAGTLCTGGVCDGDGTPACVNCVNNAAAGATDAGCSAATPACDASASGGAGACVACLADGDCGGGGVCVAQACVACEDNLAGSATDHGCSAAAPLCDTSGAAAACVECLGNGDCPLGEFCNPSGTCAPGCTTSSDCAGTPGTPLCDTGAQACVECLSATDCGDGNSCTIDACTGGACSNDAAALGASCTGGICDGSTTAPACVTCVNNAADGATDTGCSAAAPACDASANGGSGACVECQGALHCADGNACTSDVCTAGTCVNAAEPSGTACAGGVCDAGAIPACVACVEDSDCSAGVCAGNACAGCVDDQTGLTADHGCSGATPLCDTSGVPACVGCIGAGDCDDSNACTQDACNAGSCANTPSPEGSSCSGGVCDGASAPSCATCVDNAASGATDSGCTGTAPACDESAAGGAGTCFACVIDADCDGGGVCVSNACVECADDQSGVTTDRGCNATSPLCDVSGALPTCVECLGNGDCAVGEICNPAGTCAPGCSDDDDCAGSPSTPLCDTDAQACVECLGAGECDDSDTCTADSCESGGCVNAPEPLGSACTGGICDGEAVPACVACVDDEPAGNEDSGCTSTAPACDASASGGLGACLECLGDDDCEGVAVCNPDNTCSAPDGDTDGDGVADGVDLDDDNDGVSDAAELGGDDPVDTDEDGVSNHRDRDSDGDGLTDAYESGAGDDDGDGAPDACEPVTVTGECSGGSVATPVNTDTNGEPDFLDTDSDDDGLLDIDEAFDDDGDGTGNVIPAGSDTDGDGIDDAFDGDCVVSADCGGIVGRPVEATLQAWQDENGDDQPDWLQTCGDAYLTGAEPCDDGNLTDGDACSNACLLGLDESCSDGDTCDSGLCDEELTSCQSCVDDTPIGADSGCDTDAPTCVRIEGANVCTVCADTSSAIDDGCPASAPVCDDAAGGGLGACFGCLSDGDCESGEECSNERICTPIEPSGCQSDDDCLGNTVCTIATGACVFGDHDGDGVRDDADLDDDGDGIADDVELGRDASADDDMDGILDFEDADFIDCRDSADTNGVCDELPLSLDRDGDGSANHLDDDADGDGVEDTNEGYDDDFDGEADRDAAGSDTDGDGLDDAFDADCDSAAACGGVIGAPSTEPDLDDDGEPNYLDPDDDGDKRSTADEREDADDYEGPAEDPTDIDGDGLPNWLDADSDGDGASDELESQAADADGNGIRDALDPLFRSPDEDGDGLLDVVECPPPAYPADGNCPDTDGDGTPDYQDLDSDDDGLSDADELEAGTDPLVRDTDGDGLTDGDEVHEHETDPTVVDTDGDGLTDGDEVDEHGTDPNVVDTDGDGTPDGEEVEADTDPLQPPGKYSLQGGSLFGCSTAVGSSDGGAWTWLAISALALACRRRRASRSAR